MSTLNLTLLTDLYELTMMQGYFKNHNQDVVVFDAFYRNNPCDGGYSVCAGLAQVIDYIENLHFDADDINYLRSLKIFDEDFLEYLAGSDLIYEDTVIIVEASLDTDFGYLPELGYSLIKEKRYKTNKHVFIEKAGKEEVC